MRVIEFLTEAFAWLLIWLSVTLLSGLVAGIVYLADSDLPVISILIIGTGASRKYWVLKL